MSGWHFKLRHVFCLYSAALIIGAFDSADLAGPVFIVLSGTY